MTYASLDKLQNTLGEKVFHYTKDKKKAAGRALGTIVEIISYYLLKTWGLNHSISIERSLVEYGNKEISHNVEYSLHPIINKYEIAVKNNGKSITATRILRELEKLENVSKFARKSNNLLDAYNVLRNGCTVAESKDSFLVANIKISEKEKYRLFVIEQLQKPYAIFECKRVGVEEGVKKGPQTIEKAKQGAYVARIASSLQKIRTNDGEKFGIIYKAGGEPYIKPCIELMEEIIYSDNIWLLQKFILTVGIVSNHGNWFTMNNHNKELKVLAESYDWLVFLTDKGLVEFIDDLLLNPIKKYVGVQRAFKESYTEDKKRNVFTKVRMDFEANNQLTRYFSEKLEKIENWFNVIGPVNKSIGELRKELYELRSKDWGLIR